MNEILIYDGTIVNSSGCQQADVLIKDGKINLIQQNIEHNSNYKCIDAKGKYIIPGGIDPHVHFKLKTPAGYSADDFYTGSRAAIAGGTTSIIDFVTPEKDQSLIDALKIRLEDAKNCQCNYSFHMSPISWNDETANEMNKIKNAYGISSFKTYMAYKSSIGLDDIDLLNVMKQAAKLNALVTIHAEDNDLIEKLRIDFVNEGKTSPKYHALSRPAEAEAMAVGKAINMAIETGASIYFVHISAKESVKLIQNAQESGYPIYGETCPQYLLFDDSKLTDDFTSSAPFIFSPALHDSSHKEILWNALKNNTLQTVGTDHCPFNLKGQKDLGRHDFTKIPNGTGGVEHRIQLLYTYGVLKNKITLEQWVAITSKNVSDIFNVKNKGQIKEGYDADLVLFDPNNINKISVKSHHQNCDNNIYNNLEVHGKIEKVFIKGNLVFDNGILNTQKGTFISH
ncbi:MAG: dihydropyrimidinase [Salinivirgaceae bacterium]|nr:dihydropyrimidinase [Salinivirgaceae bacterium]